MKRLICIPILAFLTFLALGCGAAPGTSDADLAKAVKHNLQADPKLAGDKIDVEAKNGVVTLKGTVLQQDEAEEALRLAKSVPNVTQVRSDLELKPTITTSDAENRVDAEEKQAQENLNKQTDNGAGGVLSDTKITAEVKAKLAGDSMLSIYRIDVDTQNGVVTLTGTVKNESEARHAIAIAEAVDDVKHVQSVLKLKS